MPEKSDGGLGMPRSVDWHTEITVIAGPRLPGDTRESWMARAARKAGITFRQCKALYYGETVNPRASVAIGVVTASRKAREEAAALASQFENLAGRMNAVDSDFHSPEIVALLDAARLLRGVDRS